MKQGFIAPGLHSGITAISAHPYMSDLPDIGVARKMDSSEYRPYACGSIFRAP
jgi:hypothetical protein